MEEDGIAITAKKYVNLHMLGSKAPPTSWTVIILIRKRRNLPWDLTLMLSRTSIRLSIIRRSRKNDFFRI